MVEPAYASLSVEPPKGSLTVEPAYASLTVEPAYASLTVEYLKVLMVEHPKGTESLTIHMVRVRKHTRLSRPPSRGEKDVKTSASGDWVGK
jgi:hypothetical protein